MQPEMDQNRHQRQETPLYHSYRLNLILSAPKHPTTLSCDLAAHEGAAVAALYFDFIRLCEGSVDGPKILVFREF